MRPRFAIPIRCTAVCVSILGVLGWVIAPGLSAQTTSSMLGRLQPVKQSNRISANADYGPSVTLPQKLPSWARLPNQLAEQPPDLSKPLQVSILLSRATPAEAAFTQLLADQQNPASPFFHQWLTPQQVGELYGPTQSDRAAITSWLASQGLTIDSTSPNGLILRASGSIAAVGGAFHLSFGMFSHQGRSRLSALSAPSIPTALGTVIRSVHGLSQAEYAPQSRVSVRTVQVSGNKPQVDLGGGSYAVLPNDFSVDLRHRRHLCRW